MIAGIVHDVIAALLVIVLMWTAPLALMVGMFHVGTKRRVPQRLWPTALSPVSDAGVGTRVGAHDAGMRMPSLPARVA